jgi:hypothetical protein
MEPVTAANLKPFFQRLSERYAGPSKIYLLGGSALCLLGSPRVTLDVDYTFEVAAEQVARFQAAVAELASEMRLDLEDIPFDEFVPLPPGAYERRRIVGRFGRLEVYIFDPYSIALSKIARGFEADLEDVLFMLRKRLIEFGRLERSLPPARTRLITEVLAFVCAAGQLPGVVRIALIGSLATAKPDPKDADVLVTVTDDADLAPLATLGRKLQGHAQGFNRGGEVFLADPRGNYLGRTCPWKRCGPGIRMRCDALHCGRRPYLHDDLGAMRLPQALIAAPPIELWPEIVTRVPIPQDVEQGLIVPLRGKQKGL